MEDIEVEKQYKILHAKGWSGKMFSTLSFENGVAVTSDPAFLAYFKRHPNVYKIEELEIKTIKTTRKKEVKNND